MEKIKKKSFLGFSTIFYELQAHEICIQRFAAQKLIFSNF